MGLGYGALYALLLFGMSGGVFGETTSLDHWASGTVLDSGDQCEEALDTPWIHAYPDNDAEFLKISGRNLGDGVAILNWTITSQDPSAEPDPSQDEVEKRNVKIDYSEWDTGEYQMIITIDMYPKDTVAEDINESNREEYRKNGTERITKNLSLIHISEPTRPY